MKFKIPIIAKNTATLIIDMGGCNCLEEQAECYKDTKDKPSFYVPSNVIEIPLTVQDGSVISFFKNEDKKQYEVSNEKDGYAVIDFPYIKNADAKVSVNIDGKIILCEKS